MSKDIRTDGDFDEPRYPAANWSSRDGHELSDPWSDRAFAEREDILRRWAEVSASFRQLRRIREPSLYPHSAAKPGHERQRRSA
jgi:hypothetical protein